VHGQWRPFPGLQQAHQLAGRQLVGHLVGQELGDAAPLARRAQPGLDVVGAQPSVQSGRRAAAGAGELPLCVAAQRAEKRLVMRQVGRGAGRAAALEIGRARHPQPAHMSDQPRRQRRIGQRADAQRNVDAFLDQVDVAVAQQQLDLHAVMGIEEARDDRRDVAAAELHRGGDAQQAAHRRVRRARRCGLIVGDQRARPVVERAAGLAGRQPARRPVDQAEADAVLE
jgi:hypothetical protein